jgi:hypothetical protein
VNPCSIPQFENEDGTQDRHDQGRGQGRDTEKQSQCDTSESDMGKAVAYHGVSPENEKNTEDGTGKADENTGKNGPLHETELKNLHKLSL